MNFFSQSMLTFEYWSLDGNQVVSNYHYCPDYTLNVLFDDLPRKWLYSTFTLLSDSSSSTEEETQPESFSYSEEDLIFLSPTSSTNVPELILLNLFDF